MRLSKVFDDNDMILALIKALIHNKWEDAYRWMVRYGKDRIHQGIVSSGYLPFKWACEQSTLLGLKLAYDVCTEEELKSVLCSENYQFVKSFVENECNLEKQGIFNEDRK